MKSAPQPVHPGAGGHLGRAEHQSDWVDLEEVLMTMEELFTLFPLILRPALRVRTVADVVALVQRGLGRQPD
jgi:hypothetical protein